MTDSAFTVPAILGQQHTATPLSQRGAVSASSLRYPAPVPEDPSEDDGQISCECGYLDDDGSTVACDSCNRWQHQLCYYPQFEEQLLPDGLEHYCVSCRPRAFDKAAARERQRLRREEQATLTNGIRRPSSKSHKKKVKEPVYTNGWPMDKSRHDRNSASPRDLAQPQPPPAKRPKTSHRTSDSTSAPAKASNQGQGHSRKRTASNINHRRSLSRSPESPIGLYSSEFVQRYREDKWTEPRNNLFDSIAISNSLSEWLTLPDDEFRERHGHNKAEALMRWDGELDDIPGRAELEIQQVTDDRVTNGPLAFPTWKVLTVKEPVASGGYIGEIKGHVGFKQEYVDDPANRWALLRHPEPFVFFHPRLPVYIDARSEGTQLRYVRRSCSPNANLQILVTNQTDYHFCFMATQQIEPGMEIAVPWDMANGFHTLGQTGADLDLEGLKSWVSQVLANCGPCACHAEPTAECAMMRFDKRVVPGVEDVAPAVKAPKAKSRKRQNASPLQTHVNSRSGSEVRRIDGEDEHLTDSRSVSGSAGRGSASRDITPNTHYSNSVSMPELSERERKKLAKEEEMFRRQEEQSGKQNKKKRHSGGSSLSAPSTIAKQPGQTSTAKYADASTGRPSGLPANKSGTGKRTKRSATPKVRKKIIKTVPRTRPDYVDSAVQCDLDEVEQQAVQVPYRGRPYISRNQRLMDIFLSDHSCEFQESDAQFGMSPGKGDEMEVDPPATISTSSPAEKQEVEQKHAIEPPEGPAVKSQTDAQDVEMQDALPAVDAASIDTVMKQETNDADEQDDHDSPENPSNATAPDADPTTDHADLAPSHLPTKPPAPPWPSQASHTSTPTSVPAVPPGQPHKPSDIHLQMPSSGPPTTASSNPANASSASAPLITPTSATSSSIVQSPLTIPSATSTTSSSTTSTTVPATATSTVASDKPEKAPPLFSPSVTASIAPSPARKKLSLSDYTRRAKAKEPQKDSDQNPTSLLSAGGGGLSASSAAHTVQPAGSSAESSAEVTAAERHRESAIIDDDGPADVKMEDAPSGDPVGDASAGADADGRTTADVGYAGDGASVAGDAVASESIEEVVGEMAAAAAS